MSLSISLAHPRRNRLERFSHQDSGLLDQSTFRRRDIEIPTSQGCKKKPSLVFQFRLFPNPSRQIFYTSVRIRVRFACSINNENVEKEIYHQRCPRVVWRMDGVFFFLSKLVEAGRWFMDFANRPKSQVVNDEIDR